MRLTNAIRTVLLLIALPCGLLLQGCPPTIAPTASDAGNMDAGQSGGVCTSDLQCSNGTRCDVSGHCVLPGACTTDHDCPTGEICDISGECVGMADAGPD